MRDRLPGWNAISERVAKNSAPPASQIYIVLGEADPPERFAVALADNDNRCSHVIPAPKIMPVFKIPGMTELVAATRDTNAGSE